MCFWPETKYSCGHKAALKKKCPLLFAGPDGPCIYLIGSFADDSKECKCEDCLGKNLPAWTNDEAKELETWKEFRHEWFVMRKVDRILQKACDDSERGFPSWWWTAPEEEMVMKKWEGVKVGENGGEIILIRYEWSEKAGEWVEIPEHETESRKIKEMEEKLEKGRTIRKRRRKTN